MLRAVIFDFNGIIVDDEPIHFELFRKVFSEEGIDLTKQAYYERYLGFDDRGAFSFGFGEHNRPLNRQKLTELIDRKALYYQQAIRNHVTIFPGAKELIVNLAGDLPLAVASGALRNEIETILTTAGLIRHFKAIVSAEDVERGKPEPDIFIKALAMLNAGMDNAIQASDCIVIEDSKEGVKGARRAGIKCLAVTNSHPAELLGEAHTIVKSLQEVGPARLAQLCA